MTDYSRQFAGGVVGCKHDPVPWPLAAISAGQVHVLFWVICPGLLFIQRHDASKLHVFFLFRLAQLALIDWAWSKTKRNLTGFYISSMINLYAAGKAFI
jgi:hypothetical protein